MAIRTSKLQTFDGKNIATEEYVQEKVNLPEGVNSIVDPATNKINENLIDPVSIVNSDKSVDADLSKLKVIGDCKLIQNADGSITLRIGPAVNSSVFNGNEGISVASVTYNASGAETATISASYSAPAHSSSVTSFMKDSGDKFTANCGSGVTTSSAAGNAVHFEDNANGKFKVYIASHNGTEMVNNSYVVGPITANGTYKGAEDSISCAVTNWKAEPKISSGANGYCANVNFTFTPSALFDSIIDFRLVKIEQLEGDSVVATWENSSSTVYCYFVDSGATLPSDVATATYSLTKKSKVISGVTYLTTSSTVNPSATGLANIAYPAFVNNKAQISPVGGNWFSTYYHTSTSGFTTWTDAEDTTMSLTASTKALNIGSYNNPQLTVKGVNINGVSVNGASSVVTNNAIYVCDANGVVDTTTSGTIDNLRLKNNFTDAYDESVSLIGTTDLQTFNRCIQYPKDDYSSYNMNGASSVNPNYSGLEGDRYAYFKFTKTGTIMSGSISFGTNADPKTEMEAGDVKIELSNGNGSWMSLVDIATTFSWGTSNKIGFSIPQAANYGSGSLNCRIVMNEDSTIKFKSISMD